MADPEEYPAEVYRRRRAAAVVGIVVALLLGVWVVGAMASGNSGAVRNTGSGSDGSAALLTSRPSSPANRPSNPPAMSASARASSTSATPSPAAGQPAAAQSPQLTTTPAPPPPPQPCPDTAVAVGAKIGQPHYAVGQRPQFSITITDSGPVPCLRDINRALRELVVTTADGKRLWSSNDCFRDTGEGVQLLQPGQPLSFDLTWAGRMSAPNCAPAGARVAAGNYLLIAHLGGLSSPPTPFSLS